MSLLTNCQIEARIRGMEVTAREKAYCRDSRAVHSALMKILGYQRELAARRAAGENPGTEIQGHRNGER